MNVKEALVSHLKANVATVSDRVFADRLPQQPTLPSIVIHRISLIPVHSHDGFSGLSMARFQVSVWADDHSTLEAVIAEVRTCLDGYKGTMGGVGGVQVGSSLLDNIADLVDPDTDWLHSPCDFLIQYNE